MVGQLNRLAMAHELSTVVLVIEQSIVIFYLITTISMPNDASISYPPSWNQDIITMVAMVSICMGDMIGRYPCHCHPACGLVYVEVCKYLHSVVSLDILVTST